MPNDIIRKLAEMQASQGGDSSQLMMDVIRDKMGIKQEQPATPDLYGSMQEIIDSNRNAPKQPPVKGYAFGGRVSAGDLYSQDRAEKEALEAAEAQRLANEEGMQQAEALNAFARTKAQNEGFLSSNSPAQHGASGSWDAPAPAIQELPGNTGPSLSSRISAKLQDVQRSGDVGIQEPAKRTLASPASTPNSIGIQQAAPQKPLSPYGDDLNDASLMEAQKQANLLRLIGGLSNAGSTIGAAASRGTLPAKQIGDDLIKNADQGVKDISLRRDAKDKDVAREKNLLDLSTERQRADPKSDISRFGQAIAKKLSATTGIPLNNIDTSSWSALKEAIPGLEKYAGMMEATAARKDSSEDRKASQKEKSDEKKEVQSRLSDKQVAGIAEFDDSISKMTGALNMLGDKSGWVGPGDGRIPDMAVGADQVAFRSAVGRMKDAYRKLVTGAGASNMEIARLESRIPSETDTIANFKAKAQEFIKEINKARTTYLGNYKKQGKNTKNFEESESLTTSNEDPRIDAFMKANNIKDRAEATKILKDAGKL